MDYQMNHTYLYTLLLLICFVSFHPSDQTVSNGQFLPGDIQMKRFSNTISISIHDDIPDLVSYQVFLQIVFRLPEANAQNLVVYRQPADNGGASYSIQGARMNNFLPDPILHSKMLADLGITTHDDENVLDFIDHYIPDFSIRYYTCESFIFTSINNAFQSSENFDDLIKLRLIVTDLHNLLRVKLGSLSFNEQTTNGPFYKVEMMSLEKLHLLKQSIDKYITIHSFLSTTINKTQAFDFINTIEPHDQTKQVIVLYVIEMNDQNDIQQLVQPFANVTSMSCTAHQEEILFSIGQIFQIRSISQTKTTGIWTVDLQVLHVNDTQHLTNLTEYYLSKIIGTETFYNGIQARVNVEPLTITTSVTIGNYYSSIIRKNYTKAEFYYKRFLNEELESPDDFDVQSQSKFSYARIYHLYYMAQGYVNLQLARIRCEQNKCVEALEYNQKARDACLKVTTNAGEQTLVARIYTNLADISWKHTQRYDQAASHYLHAVQMDINNIETFINIGLTQTAAGEHWHALNSFSIALSMIQTRNETDYLSYGLVKSNIGQIYEKSDDNFRAWLSYWEAETIYNQSLPSNHELRQSIREDIKRVTRTITRVHDDL